MAKALTEFYVACNTTDERGGCVHYTLNDDETLTRGALLPIPGPKWTELDGGRLCALLRDPELGECYAEYSIASGRRITEAVPTLGRSVCHFSKDGDDVYCANYATGSVFWIHGEETALFEHTTESFELGSDAERQERPHCHQCLLSPDRRFVLVCDLGLDSVFVYDRSMKLVSRGKVPDGHGARHSIFSHDGKKLYTLSEMASSVTEFDWDGETGELTCRYTVSFKPEGHEGLSDAASILLSPDGRHLYCTNRGTANTIAHLTLGEDGRWKVVSQTECGADHPRCALLVAGGRYLVCCCTFGNRMNLFRVEEDGELTPVASEELPAPLCANEI